MQNAASHTVATPRYVMSLSGERDECGLSESVFSFQASLESRGGGSDLSTIQGLTLEREGRGDVCVRISDSQDTRISRKPVKAYYGEIATRLINNGVDLVFTLAGRNIMFLYNPCILNPDEEFQPGTRLISSLKQHHASGSLEVLCDLGTDEESQEFVEYFFPDMHLLGLEMIGLRVARGHWGSMPGRMEDACRFGVIYE